MFAEIAEMNGIGQKAGFKKNGGNKTSFIKKEAIDLFFYTSYILFLLFFWHIIAP